MISSACYVQCDRCGDPAEVSTEGAIVALSFARQQGYIRVPKRIMAGKGCEDVCPRCIEGEDDDA